MQNIDEIIGNFLEQDTESNIMTPETLAWNLVMSSDTDLEDFTGVMHKFVSDDSGNFTANMYEQMSDEFQILVTIYFEMIFMILKSNYLGSLLDENGDIEETVDIEEKLENYKPDFKQYDLDAMTNIFREKFVKIRYFLSVLDITDQCTSDPTDFGIHSEYYCKTLLLDDERGATKKYFNQADHIPDTKRYTFLIRQDSKRKQKKLKDFYTVVYVPPYKNTGKPRKIRISFEKINVIVENQHIFS